MVTVYMSKYSRNTPSNAAPMRIGYGVTPSGARQNLIDRGGPWNNQAPYLSANPASVVLRDGDDPFGANADTAWNACLGFVLEDLPYLTHEEKNLLQALRAGRFATAICLAVEMGRLS